MDGTLAPFNKLLQITDEFEGTMRNNFLLSIGPGLANISGVYLLHSGIAASMGLFYAGTAVGLANTLLPLIRHQDTHLKQIENPKIKIFQQMSHTQQHINTGVWAG